MIQHAVDESAWNEDAAWYRQHAGNQADKKQEARFCLRVQLNIQPHLRAIAEHLETSRNQVLKEIHL